VIALVVNGSLGDVQPFIALAQELRRRGRRAILFTNYDFLGLCKSAGVEAVATYTGWTDLINIMGGINCPDFFADQKGIPTQDILKFVESTLSDARAHQAAKEWKDSNPGRIMDSYEALVKYKPYMMVYALQSQNSPIRYEHVHKVPAIPVYFTSAFGRHFTRSRPPRPSLFATSPALDIRLSEDNNHITGPWLLQQSLSNQEIEANPSLAAVKSFIEAGEKPVALGWGSMLPQDMPASDMLGLALRALRIAGRRAIILGGWARLHELGCELLAGGLTEIGTDHEALRKYALEKVCFVEHAPHHWLYPRCHCVVNHGGSGTVHAALRAGCPVVVTPIYGDQFHFAQRVSKLGVGVGLQKSLQHVDFKELSRAIIKAMAKPCVEKARAFVPWMKKDGGTSLAVDILESFLTTQVETGRFKAEASSTKQKQTG